MSENNVNNSLANVNNFNFNAEHNGVQCIESLDLKDKGTERQYWFTVAMLCTIYNVAERTLRDNLQSLVDDGEIVDCENSQSTINTKDSLGRCHKTTIYNLEVLNKLGMCCFRGNKTAKETRNKFNDVLVKHETSQSIPQTPQTYLEALKALVIAVEEKEKAEMQALFEAEQKQLALEQRDRAIATKAHFVEGRDAEMCGRVGGLTKANTDLRQKNTQLTNANTELTTENDKLKNEAGIGKDYKQVRAIKFVNQYFCNINRNFWIQLGKELSDMSKSMDISILPCQSSKYGTINCYHIAVINEFKRQLDNGVIFSRLKNYHKNIGMMPLFK